MSLYKDYGFATAEAHPVHSYILEPVLSNLDKNKNKCILDLGCGNGALAKKLLQVGFNVYGTDASEQGISIAKESYPDRFTIQDISSEKLPEEFAHLTFDTIISTEVIEHLYDPRGFIKFCKNILSEKKGELILTTPYHGYLKNLSIALSGKWDAHANPLWDGGHIKLWSTRTLKQLLEEQGFKVTVFRGCGRFPYFWKSMMLKAKLQ
jgi:2-polyprenyl-3-methyl-5-hydroxy-6-metoxy-1,4-benzoquinol methylase